MIIKKRKVFFTTCFISSIHHETRDETYVESRKVPFLFTDRS